MEGTGSAFGDGSVRKPADVFGKRTQTTQTRLRRSNASLPPDGGLHPHALRSCYSFEPPALAYRSRFVVAVVLVNPVSNAKAAAGAAREPWRSESDALLRAERPRLCGLCSFSSKDSGKLQTVPSYEDA